MIKGNTLRENEKIKVLNQIHKKIKEVEASIPIQIKQAIDDLVNGAPEALDTLKEIVDNFVQVNWNQNNNEKLDYIKNRICWEEDIDDENFEYELNTFDQNQYPVYTNRFGYKITSLGNDEYKIDFYKESELITSYVCVNDSSNKPYAGVKLRCSLKKQHSVGSSLDSYVNLYYDVLNNKILKNNLNFYSYSVENGITYVASDDDDEVVPQSLKFHKIGTIVHKLDEKYIPSSIIQRIEALEQAIQTI